MSNKNKYSAFEVFTIHTLIQSGLSLNETNNTFNNLRAKDNLPQITIPKGTYESIRKAYSPTLLAQPNTAQATALQALLRFSISSLNEHFNTLSTTQDDDIPTLYLA